MVKRVARWLVENSMWVISLGLMLASSGLDGIYIARWMPEGWGWLGLVLNTMSDIGNLVLMYWYGRLKLAPRGSKRHRLATALLPAEGIAVAYSWFFSWRQLRAVLPGVEPAHWRWVAPIAAGFIPLMLAFIGWAQALLAGRIETEPVASQRSDVEPASSPIEPYVCATCERTFRSQAGLNAHQRVHAAKSNGSDPAREPEIIRGER